MVDPRRLFEQLPPAEPLTSLGALVRDWDRRYIRGPFDIHRDPVIAYTAAADTWEEACDRACRSRGADGKMWNHQSRVPLYILLALRDRLEAHQDDVERVMAEDLDGDSFHGLHDYIVRVLAPPGIGPVTAYDVATRLAEWFDIAPQSVYLHAGPTVGWDAITNGLIRTAGNKQQAERWVAVRERTRRRKRIERGDMPASLRRLADREKGMDQVEDFLCAYRHIMVGGEVTTWH